MITLTPDLIAAATDEEEAQRELDDAMCERIALERLAAKFAGCADVDVAFTVEMVR